MNEYMAMSTIVTARARNIEGPVVLGEVVHLIRKKPRGSASSPASSDETAVPVGTIREFLPPNAIPDNDRMYTRNDFFVSDCSVSGVGMPPRCYDRLYTPLCHVATPACPTTVQRRGSGLLLHGQLLARRASFTHNSITLEHY